MMGKAGCMQERSHQRWWESEVVAAYTVANQEAESEELEWRAGKINMKIWGYF